MSDLYLFTGSGNCRSCGASILWFRTPTGKSMPVDDRREARNPNRADGLYEEGDTLTRSQAIGTILVHCHFSSCPNADQHRRGR